MTWTLRLPPCLWILLLSSGRNWFSLNQCIHDKSVSLALILLVLQVLADACLFRLFHFFSSFLKQKWICPPSPFFSLSKLEIALYHFWVLWDLSCLPWVTASSFAVTSESALNILGHSRVQYQSSWKHGHCPITYFPFTVGNYAWFCLGFICASHQLLMDFSFLQVKIDVKMSCNT